MGPSSTRELSDAERLLRFRAGDAQAFGAIYDRYAPSLLVYARSLTGNAALSEDVVQEAFLRLLEVDPDRLQGEAKAFLFAIVRNLIIDEHRKKLVDTNARPLLPLRSREAVPTADPAELSNALFKLPEEQREAVTLKIYGQMTFSQIAEVTGTSAATIASRYRYALEKLGQLLPRK